MSDLCTASLHNHKLSLADNVMGTLASMNLIGSKTSKVYRKVSPEVSEGQGLATRYSLWKLQSWIPPAGFEELAVKPVVDVQLETRPLVK